jgi:F-type H+-transporting ATPase subunit a
MSWIVIAALAILAYLGTRRMRKVPGPLQNVLEMTVSSLFNFIESVIGPGSRKYCPFVATLFLYILVMNVMGVIPGFKSPTSGLNMTVALALCAFFYVQYSAIRANGLWGYIKHMTGEPIWLAPLMLPIHLIGELAKPLSLSIRLFGNIFGEDKIIVILAGLVALSHMPVVKYIPIQFPMLLFAVFTSVIQALIFTVLTAAYITIMVAHGDESHGASASH